DPQNASVVGDEGLAITGLVRDSYILEIARESIIHLLLFHDAEDQIAGIFGNQLSSRHHFQQLSDFARGTVAEIDARIVDCVTESLLHLLFAVSIKRESNRLVSAGLVVARVQRSKPLTIPIKVRILN